MTNSTTPEVPPARLASGEAANDLVQRLRNTPNWLRESYGHWKDCVSSYDRAPFEAADEIERLRASVEGTDEPYAWFWTDGSDSGVLTMRQDFESHQRDYPNMRFTPVWSTPQIKHLATSPPAPSETAAQATGEAVALPDGHLHDDGYFTWAPHRLGMNVRQAGWRAPFYLGSPTASPAMEPVAAPTGKAEGETA